MTKQRQLFFLTGRWSDDEVRLRVVEFVRTDDSVPLYPLVDLGLLAVGGWKLLSSEPRVNTDVSFTSASTEYELVRDYMNEHVIAVICSVTFTTEPGDACICKSVEATCA